MMAGGQHVVLVDANVLYSRTLRDWLALTHSERGFNVFTVRWTEDILAETVAHIRERNPFLSGDQIAWVRDGILAAFPDGKVRSFEIDPTLPYPDPKDAHVHAAALACGADLVLTNDRLGLVIGDDPDAFGYEVVTPDVFFTTLDDSCPALIRSVTLNQVCYRTKRRGESHLPHALVGAGAPTFAQRVRQHLQALAPQIAGLHLDPSN